jgi:hypothetical protein
MDYIYIYIYISLTLIRLRPPSYFTHISITTLIASALKNHYTVIHIIHIPQASYVEPQTEFFKPLLDPGNRFRIETVTNL